MTHLSPIRLDGGAELSPLVRPEGPDRVLSIQSDSLCPIRPNGGAYQVLSDWAGGAVSFPPVRGRPADGLRGPSVPPLRRGRGPRPDGMNQFGWVFTQLKLVGRSVRGGECNVLLNYVKFAQIILSLSFVNIIYNIGKP